MNTILSHAELLDLRMQFYQVDGVVDFHIEEISRVELSPLAVERLANNLRDDPHFTN